MQRCGELRHVLSSPDLSLTLKLRLYKVAVCSVLTYGCEGWRLTNPIKRMINGANSRMLSRFTGNSIPQEARPNSTTFDLVKAVRKQRLKWLGCILRAYPNRLVHQALLAQYQSGMEGTLLMDAPPHNSFDDLVAQARDTMAWQILVTRL